VQHVTITTFGCREYLRRRGFITEGELAYVDVTRRQNIRIAEIQARVAQFYGLDRREMTSDRRSREVARPRQVAMYLAKQLTKQPLTEIGRRFGGRDHTTVIHAIRRIEQLRVDDREIERAISYLDAELSA